MTCSGCWWPTPWPSSTSRYHAGSAMTPTWSCRWAYSGKYSSLIGWHSTILISDWLIALVRICMVRQWTRAGWRTSSRWRWTTPTSSSVPGAVTHHSKTVMRCWSRRCSSWSLILQLLFSWVSCVSSMLVQTFSCLQNQTSQVINENSHFCFKGKLSLSEN